MLTVFFCWSNTALGVPIIDDDRSGYLIAFRPTGTELDQDLPAPHRSTAAMENDGEKACNGRDDVQRWSQQLLSEEAAKPQQAADRLAALGPDAVEAVPSLIDCLDDDDVKTACKAAYALGQIGIPAAKAAVPNLHSMLKRKEPEARVAAVETLGIIGLSSENFDETAKALADAAANDPDENVRRAASKITKPYIYRSVTNIVILIIVSCFVLRFVWKFFYRMPPSNS